MGSSLQQYKMQQDKQYWSGQGAQTLTMATNSLCVWPMPWGGSWTRTSATTSGPGRSSPIRSCWRRRQGAVVGMAW
eukprot:13427093-Heterocapsa_arctica.AAC.1